MEKHRRKQKSAIPCPKRKPVIAFGRAVPQSRSSCEANSHGKVPLEVKGPFKPSTLATVKTGSQHTVIPRGEPKRRRNVSTGNISNSSDISKEGATPKKTRTRTTESRNKNQQPPSRVEFKPKLKPDVKFGLNLSSPKGQEVRKFTAAMVSKGNQELSFLKEKIEAVRKENCDLKQQLEDKEKELIEKDKIFAETMLDRTHYLTDQNVALKKKVDLWEKKLLSCNIDPVTLESRNPSDQERISIMEKTEAAKTHAETLLAKLDMMNNRNLAWNETLDALQERYSSLNLTEACDVGNIP